jgi:hypothetical protein
LGLSNICEVSHIRIDRSADPVNKSLRLNFGPFVLSLLALPLIVLLPPSCSIEIDEDDGDGKKNDDDDWLFIFFDDGDDGINIGTALACAGE